MSWKMMSFSSHPKGIPILTRRTPFSPGITVKMFLIISQTKSIRLSDGIRQKNLFVIGCIRLIVRKK
jgi:hypothetical protein